MVGPAAERAAVAHLQTVMDLSERRACQIVGADRTMVRYRSRRQPEMELRTRLRDLANERRRFHGLKHARERIAEWVEDYNHRRPHSALGYSTPASYAARFPATNDRLRDVEKLRQTFVAKPAPAGVQTAEALIPSG